MVIRITFSSFGEPIPAKIRVLSVFCRQLAASRKASEVEKGSKQEANRRRNCFLRKGLLSACNKNHLEAGIPTSFCALLCFDSEFLQLFRLVLARYVLVLLLTRRLDCAVDVGGFLLYSFYVVPAYSSNLCL